MKPIEYYQLIERSLDAQLGAARRNDWDMVKRIQRVVRSVLIKHLKTMLASRANLSEDENQVVNAIVERVATKDKELFELARASNPTLVPKHLH